MSNSELTPGKPLVGSSYSGCGEETSCGQRESGRRPQSQRRSTPPDFEPAVGLLAEQPRGTAPTEPHSWCSSCRASSASSTRRPRPSHAQVPQPPPRRRQGENDFGFWISDFRLKGEKQIGSQRRCHQSSSGLPIQNPESKIQNIFRGERMRYLLHARPRRAGRRRAR